MTDTRRRWLTYEPAVIDATFYVDEVATAATGSVSVTVTEKDGTAVVGPVIASAGTGTGNYKTTVNAQTDPKVLVATWTATVAGVARTLVTEHEIVGAHLFSLADLRVLPGMEDVVRFPDSKLREMRDEVTDLFNDYTNTAFGATWYSETFDGNSEKTLELTKFPVMRLYRVTIGGTTQTISSWTVDSVGRVLTDKTLTAATYGQNVVFQYIYGEPRVPRDVRRASRILARTWLLGDKSSIPDRARMMQTDMGQFVLSTAGDDYPTGIPDVDAVLNRYSKRIPGFA